MTASRPLRRVLRALAVAVTVVALAGCASIPTTGSVVAGVPVDTDGDQSFAFNPSGPTADASPEQIIRGFLAAAVRPLDDYQVARQFLTTDFEETWDPNTGAVLHEGPNTIKDEGNGSYQLTVGAVAQIGRAGSFVEYGDVYDSNLSFQLAEVDGQWRIAEAPDGVVLLRQTFQRLYSQRTLYFFDPAFESLVPDVRWFPNTADAPTRIVEALLAGPVSTLATPVLASAFPAGASLQRQSVVQSDGVVTVDLDESIVGAGTTSLQRMKLQLTRSLIGGSVVSVQLRAGGGALEVPDFTSGAPVLQAQVDPRAAVGVGDQFGWLSSGEISPIDGLSAQISALAPSAVSLDSAAGRAAVLGDGGVLFVRDQATPVVVDSRDGLIPPALDALGYTWSVPRNEPGALQVSDGSGNSSSVPTTWSELASVASIGVSKDGTRVLVFGSSDGPSMLRVYGIVRDADGRPTALSSTWFDMIAPTGAPVGATWVDESTVASIATPESGESRAMLQIVGGISEQLSRPGIATAIVGANGQSGLRVLTADGNLQVLRGAGWQVTARGIGFVANQR